MTAKRQHPQPAQADKAAADRDRVKRGQGTPSGPNSGELPFAGTTPAASRYTPGPDVGGEQQGGVSAADLTGGGAGGDIDNPDITGRGTTADILQADEAERKADEVRTRASKDSDRR